MVLPSYGCPTPVAVSPRIYPCCRSRALRGRRGHPEHSQEFRGQFSMRIKPFRQKVANRTKNVARVLASVLSALLFASAIVTGAAAVPAQAMEGASILVVKTVDGKPEARDLRPGDTVVYRVEVPVND